MPTQKKRFPLDLEPEMQVKLKVAAALKGVTMRRYCIDIIGKELDRNDLPGDDATAFTKASFDQLIELRDKIFQGRKSPSDSGDLIREAREQRTEELDRLSGS
ncbi:MAG: hypothetical protein O3A93_09200 [Chloroflexi bacterium]|nr:hypothetical protein [Chloroflexota bacterium]MDA1271423.1 hypothetical protein [Chloroflexota bacterium]PKB58962.1 MAG: hypothetical protein BZY83_04225 [SAR202 cluster bacterium Casp-Chloro-G2]